MSFFITGTGSAIPGLCVPNDALSGFLDTNDEWIRTRTGIRQRNILTSESLLDLAERSAIEALSLSKCSPLSIDMIICSTLHGDFFTPSMSCLLSKRLGINCRHMLDINMGCSGFIFALELAAAYFDSKRVKRVLIVCAEAMSRLVDWEDRSTCVLFGDGAGAVILEEGEGLIDLACSIDGEYENLNIPGIEGNSPFSQKRDTMPYLNMNGQEIYKFAVSAIINDITSMLEKNAIPPDDVAYYFLHQANIRIIESARHKLKQPEEKFPCNIESCGNTSSATIPILLDEVNRQGKIKKGDVLLLSAFGSGLTSAVALLRWN
ncbi:MAG: ketoacyl-ACP synthase III [Clostridiales bacterium]|nr:ketoacyl-ACP synthase III [Clostridiales bacterium]